MFRPASFQCSGSSFFPLSRIRIPVCTYLVISGSKVLGPRIPSMDSENQPRSGMTPTSRTLYRWEGWHRLGLRLLSSVPDPDPGLSVSGYIRIKGFRVQNTQLGFGKPEHCTYRWGMGSSRDTASFQCSGSRSVCIWLYPDQGF
jgi:hypothetical protein